MVSFGECRVPFIAIIPKSAQTRNKNYSCQIAIIETA